MYKLQQDYRQALFTIKNPWHFLDPWIEIHRLPYRKPKYIHFTKCFDS